MLIQIQSTISKESFDMIIDMLDKITEIDYIIEVKQITWNRRKK